MRNLLGLLLILVALAAALVWFDWSAQTREEAAETAQSQALSVPVVPRGRTREPSPKGVPKGVPKGEGGDGVREAVDVAATAKTATAGTTATILRGRCLSEASRRPLANCVIEVQNRPVGDWEMAPSVQDRTWTGTADRGGRFAIELDLDSGPAAAKPDRTVWFAVRAHGCVPIYGHEFVLPAGKVRDIGDVELRAGAYISGRVRDLSGTVVRGQRLRFAPTRSGDTHSGRERLEMPLHRYAMSARDGRFEVADRVVPGTYHLSTVDGRLLAGPKRVKIEVGQAAARLDVVVATLQPDESITGTVIDLTGSAVARAIVRAQSPASPAMVKAGIPYLNRSRTWSQEDGFFRLIRYPGSNSRAPLLLTVERHAGFAAYQHAETVRWGAKDVSLVLQPRTPNQIDVAFRVVRAGTGQPVEEFLGSYRAVPPPASGPWQSSQESIASGRYQNGLVELREVQPGHYLLTVTPKDRELFASTPIVFQVPSTAKNPLRVEVPSATAITLHVEDEAGEPVARSRVELWGKLPAAITGRVAVPAPVRHDANYTGKRGVTHLRGPAGASDLEIRVIGGDHLPLQHKGVALPEGDTTLRLVVFRGATVEGRLHPVKVWQDLYPTEAMKKTGSAWFLRASIPKLSLLEVDKLLLIPPAIAKRIAVGEDGTFTVSGVPPGRYRVMANFRTSTKFTLHTEWFEPIFEVSAGGVVQVSIDIHDFAPTTLRGRVLSRGKPLANTMLFLTGYRESDVDFRWPRFQLGLITTDENGGFVRPRLIPGLYRVGRFVGTRGASGAVRLHRGDDSVLDFHVGLKILRIKIFAADGITPHANRRVASMGGPVLTDENGVAEWKVSGTQAVTLIFNVGGKTVNRGPFRVPEDVTEATFEAKLPGK